MTKRLGASVCRRPATKRRSRDTGVVDQPADDHFGDVVVDRDAVDGKFGEPPGKLLLDGDLALVCTRTSCSITRWLLRMDLLCARNRVANLGITARSILSRR
jgi:hypothetical protein